jgi:hypothetical protein
MPRRPLRNYASKVTDIGMCSDCPEDQDSARSSNWLATFLGKYKKVVRSAEAAIAVAFWIGAVASGSDMTIYLPFLTLSWVVSSAGIATATEWSARQRFALFIVVTLIMVGTYFYIVRLHMPGEPQIQTDAIIEIAPQPVKKLIDGKYAFPIAVKNIGNAPIFNYQATFGIAFNPKILSLEEEDELFYNKNIIQILDTISNLIKENAGISRILRPNMARVEYIPQIGITESQMEDVNSGKMNAYYFFIVAYQDSPHSQFYFGQYCGRLVPKIPAFARCWHENFTKRAHF